MGLQERWRWIPIQTVFGVGSVIRQNHRSSRRTPRERDGGQGPGGGTTMAATGRHGGQAGGFAYNYVRGFAPLRKYEHNNSWSRFSWIRQECKGFLPVLAKQLNAEIIQRAGPIGWLARIGINCFCRMPISRRRSNRADAHAGSTRRNRQRHPPISDK